MFCCRRKGAGISFALPGVVSSDKIICSALSALFFTNSVNYRHVKIHQPHLAQGASPIGTYHNHESPSVSSSHILDVIVSSEEMDIWPLMHGSTNRDYEAGEHWLVMKRDMSNITTVQKRKQMQGRVKGLCRKVCRDGEVEYVQTGALTL
ncbi:hypothetical protein DER45DRAFT_560335 [Fusarium avenaceum]|nr:hypothetical protein DER45DRAFT_560335 [Fusarium avenaceum]